MSTLKYFLTISFFIAVFFLQFSSPLYAQGFSEVFSGQLDSLYGGSVAWGDYDNDGKLDILMTGVNENGFPRTNIYRNTGSGFTKVFANVLPGVATSSATWGDYDNDGDLDILITGQDTTGNISRIYQNTGSGFSEVFSGTLIGVAFSSAAWGDYDNDGKLDILITGHSNPIGEPFPLPVPVSKIYRNTGNGFTEVYAWTIKGVRESAAAWGDYDNDGKLDFILSGLDTTDVAITKLYRNTGSGFTEVYAGSFTGVRTGSLAWGDYDSDGRLDILLTGDSSNFNGVSKIYRNTGSEFTEVYTGSLTGVFYSSAAWGDYDSDGDLDILLAGNDGLFRNTKVYENTGSGFTEDIASGVLAGLDYSSVAWGDYNNDGRLDFVQSGYANGFFPISQIVTISDIPANTAPSAPTNLTTSRVLDVVTFKWNRATDTQTPGAGLTYNLRIGTTSNGVNTVSPMANASTGFRRVARIGNTNQDTSWTVKIPDTSVASYWSVQAIDNNFAGSAFATQQQIFTPPPTYTISITISPLNSGTVIKTPNLTNYNENTQVELMAIAISDYNFLNWTGDLTGSSSPVTITMNANKTITANFALITYTITATAGNNGSITPNGNVSVNHGANQQFTITPATGYHIDSVIVNGVKVDSTMSYTFVSVTITHTIRAVFAINTYTLAYTAGANGTLTGDTSQTVNHGGKGTAVTAVADNGFEFVNWSDNKTTNPRIDSNVTAHISVTANFDSLKYTLTWDAPDGDILFNPDLDSYLPGTKVILTAIPDEGYHFVEWSDSLTGSGNPDSLIMDSDKEVTANFELSAFVEEITPAQHELAVSPSTNIVVTFSVAMKPSSFNDTTSFIVTGSASGRHRGTFSFSDIESVATFNSTNDFKKGEVVTVDVSSNIKSATNVSVTPFVSQFTVSSATSSGTFAGFVNYATGIEPQSVYAGDVDGDGDVDIITANSTVQVPAQFTVSVLKNNGDGTFASKVNYPTGFGPTSVYASDVDGDGDVDIITGSSNSTAVSVLKNNGDGTYATKVDYPTGNHPTSVYASDVDGDGDVDIMTADNGSNTVSVLKNNGDGTFATKVDYTTGEYPQSVYASDVDGDGNVDILTANAGSANVSVLKNNGDGTFSVKVDITTGTNPRSIYASDIDGDGDVDILVANFSSNTVSVLKNNGDGTYATKVDYATGSSPYSVFASDIDGDGNVDILTANSGSSNVSVLKNNGDGTYATKVDYATGSSPSSVYASDIDGDGNVDILVANRGSNTVSVLKNINTYTLTTYETDGSISVEPELDEYPAGTKVILTALPDEGYHFVEWSDSLTGSGNPDSLIMDSDKEVTANFEINEYVLTTRIIGVGSITRDPDTTVYEHETDVTLVATPNARFNFSGWSGDTTDADIDDTTITFTMDSAKTITATFTIQTYTITVTQPANGTITPGTSSFNYGTPATFTITPNTNYKLAKVIANNVDVGTSSTYTFYDYTNGTLTAEMKSGTPSQSITLISPNGGEIWEVGSQHNIQWTSASVTNVKIDVTIDNKTTWNLLITSTTTSGSYLWTIPSLGGKYAYVRVSDSSNSAIQDVSDATFLLGAPMQSVNSGTTKKLNKISFSDGGGSAYGIVYYGWAVGDSVILQTADRGNSWVSKTNSPNVPQNVKWTAVTHRLSDTYTLFLGRSGNDAVVMDWKDGFKLYNPTPLPNFRPNDLFVLDVTGYAVGDSGKIYMITLHRSGPSSFTPIFTNSVSPTTENLNGIFSNYSVNSTTFYIVGDNGVVLKNDGAQWITQNSGVSVQLNDVGFYGDLGFIVGNSGTILKTTNGGTSWTSVTSGTTKNLNGITFDRNGWIVGDSGTILKFTPSTGKRKWKSDATSTDGEWTQVESGTTSNLNVAATTANGSFVTVGDGGTALTHQAKTLLLTSPTGGGNYIGGQTQTITWVSDGVNFVKLEYSPDSGQTWQSITDVVGGSAGRYDWLMPNTALQNVLVAVTDIEDSITSTTSDSVFHISIDDKKFRTFKQSLSDFVAKSVKLKYSKGKLAAQPNIMTAVENVFAKQVSKAMYPKGRTFLGVKRTDSAKVYAWMELKKAADLAKGFKTEHSGQSYPLDYLRKGDKKTKLAKALKFAATLNNPAIAQGILLKLNILASDSGVTPKGFGSLEIDTNIILAGRNLKDQTLAEVSTYLDSIMTYWKILEVDTTEAYTELGNFITSILKPINDGFYAAMTSGNYTVDSARVVAKKSFAVVLSGTKTAEELGIVRRNPNARQSLPKFTPQTMEPTKFALEQNYPNPFNPMTTIRFEVGGSGLVSLKIYNILGQEVATLLNNEELESGQHEIQFDASKLSSGVYFYRIAASTNERNFVEVKKMVLMK